MTKLKIIPSDCHLLISVQVYYTDCHLKAFGWRAIVIVDQGCKLSFQKRRWSMYKKILVPLDGSPLAEAALPHAEAIARSEGAEIILLRIPTLPATELFTREPSIAIMIHEQEQAEAVKYINTKMDDLKKKSFRVTAITQQGSVPDTILAVAEEIHADMIAMSTHGRTGIQRWLMGSVADRVVHHAHIPVLLIHPN
jgi:nucleotide-binding universal stress UspA family protein